MLQYVNAKWWKLNYKKGRQKNWFILYYQGLQYINVSLINAQIFQVWRFALAVSTSLVSAGMIHYRL